jgi:hypothetical protein
MSNNAEWRFTATTSPAFIAGPLDGSTVTVRATETCTAGSATGTILLSGAMVAAPDAWDLVATLSPTGTSTTPGGDGISFLCTYPFWKAECSAISGTGAAITVRLQKA